MRRWVAFSLAVAFLLLSPPARAGVVVQIDKLRQRMTVLVDGQSRHTWPVSTGRAGFGTPSGTFAPQRLARRWFSRRYYNSPMPYSIFFTSGYAIHGSYEISRLGGPASHGCVRLHPSHAATLFALVRNAGTGATTISVRGANPPGRTQLARSPHRDAPTLLYDRRPPAPYYNGYNGAPYRWGEPGW